MKKIFQDSLTAITFLIIITVIFSSKVFAAGIDNCQTVYGGGQVCPAAGNLQITKQVQKPTKDGEFVNNLTVNDAKFEPGQNVSFRITVSNTGQNDLNNIQVIDTFPNFLNFISGIGTFNQSSRTLTFKIDKLTSNQSRVFMIVGKVVDATSLPTNTGVVCVINQVQATSGDFSASASSNFCIQKQVLAAPAPQVFTPPALKTTPPTGPEIIPLAALLSSGLLGFYFRKKSKIS